MMLPSMLDVINKRIRQKKTLDNFASTTAAVMEFLHYAAIAEKFDFGLLPCEQAEAMKGEGFELPFFKLPHVTDDEMGFWHDGLIPLPADVCWYEFQLSKDDGFDGISGVIIRKDADGLIWTQRVEGPFQDDNSGYMVDGSWSRVALDGTLRWYNDNKQRFAVLKRLGPDKLNDLLGSSAMMTIYLTLMINSRTTEARKVVPTNKQQSLRKLLHKTPLPSHTVVTIIPQRFIDEAKESDGEAKGTRAFPRIHWRRSHVRTYNRGLSNEYVRVIPRMIIGRRELGEVKHDYVVRTKTT